MNTTTGVTKYEIETKLGFMSARSWRQDKGTSPWSAVRTAR